MYWIVTDSDESGFGYSDSDCQPSSSGSGQSIFGNRTSDLEDHSNTETSSPGV